MLCLYFIIQIALPLRHLAIKDDVLWTEEGHRLSWRMMLRSKTGYTTMYTLDKKTQEKSKYNIKGDTYPKTTKNGRHKTRCYLAIGPKNKANTSRQRH